MPLCSLNFYWLGNWKLLSLKFIHEVNECSETTIQFFNTYFLSVSYIKYIRRTLQPSTVFELWRSIESKTLRLMEYVFSRLGKQKQEVRLWHTGWMLSHWDWLPGIDEFKGFQHLLNILFVFLKFSASEHISLATMERQFVSICTLVFHFENRISPCP